MSQPHDAAYKLLFSHPAMVADLLKGYLAREWIGELDLDRLEAVAETRLSDDLRERRNDCIWRVPWTDPAATGDEPIWLYVYLLLEFQSRVDPTMPVRMLTYLGLLYQDLLRSGDVGASSLPPVLPVVLYNGQPRWTAAVQFADLVPRFPAALQPFIPQVRYLFLDEGRMATSPQWEERNLAAAVFRIEQHGTPDGIQTVAEALDAWLDQDTQASLRRALETWLVQSVLPARLPGVALPGTVSLGEVRGMLGERLRTWGDEREATGMARGIAEGKAEGIAEGEIHALTSLIRHQVAAGLLTVAQGREHIQALVDQGAISEQAGQVALASIAETA